MRVYPITRVKYNIYMCTTMVNSIESFISLFVLMLKTAFQYA